MPVGYAEARNIVFLNGVISIESYPHENHRRIVADQPGAPDKTQGP
jgi:hypothetical protein